MTPRPAPQTVARLAYLMSIALAGALFSPIAGQKALAQQGGSRPPPKVIVAKPLTERIIDFDYFTGQFQARQTVIIQARVQGYLREVHFEEGAVVEEGDLLFTLDPRPFEAEVAQAKANLALANAGRDLAVSNESRASELLRRRVGTQSDADTAQAELAQAQASVGVAQAQVDTAELNLSFSKLTAPISGRISAVRVDRGNLVTTASVLTNIVAVDPVEFTFEASEAQYLRYQRLAKDGSRSSSRNFQNEVSVRLTGEQDWSRKGRMTFVDNVLDANSGTIEGRAVFDNQDRLLTPGLYGRLRLPASGLYDAVLIPDAAVVSDQNRKIVYVVNDKGVVESRAVQLGELFENLRVVRSGLTAEERVVVEGILRVRANAQVDPTERELEIDRDRGKADGPQSTDQEG
ncbi:efflux RND transporter periplasmic adaptor subunit [Ahrensia sp. R2A130]|uniref:efflux RND transporter periplasmic adaptor subunit n=1 Tax=Ahrensia sp. R2A130 TaxID=744979 RepID=UPI0001E0F11C|nr:efflux RND transporter periplasmic adaptor subunit [Ahrensia sp. R2A130]EFL87497.1 secretion protein HlyD [Ahrensia sp. R2A130]